MLGLVQYGMGDMKGGLDSLQRAAAMGSNMLGDHEDLASGKPISFVQRDMGDLKEALESLEKSADATFNLLGYNKFMVAAYLSLTVKRREMGDFEIFENSTEHVIKLAW